MSARDKAFGLICCLLAVLMGVIYFYAIYGGYGLYALYIVVSLMVLLILGVLFWIGYTIATTPSIEEIEKAAK